MVDMFVYWARLPGSRHWRRSGRHLMTSHFHCVCRAHGVGDTRVSTDFAPRHARHLRFSRSGLSVCGPGCGKIGAVHDGDIFTRLAASAYVADRQERDHDRYGASRHGVFDPRGPPWQRDDSYSLSLATVAGVRRKSSLIIRRCRVRSASTSKVSPKMIDRRKCCYNPEKAVNWERLGSRSLLMSMRLSVLLTGCCRRILA
jgi:hypothetical protein